MTRRDHRLSLSVILLICAVLAAASSHRHQQLIQAWSVARLQQ